MNISENPQLSVVLAPLTTETRDRFAIWITAAPFPGGYVHHDCMWTEQITEKWLLWQEMFSLQDFSLGFSKANPTSLAYQIPPQDSLGYGGGLMQSLGIELWQWLFSGAIRSSLEKSSGIAIGQNKALRIKLEIRDPRLVPLPWEIMQPQAGKSAISLQDKFLFSRTTSDVDPLKPQILQEQLKILLVLGQPETSQAIAFDALDLQKESERLLEVMQWPAPHQGYTSQVDVLVQPHPEELLAAFDRGIYNVFFYAGHGVPGQDGGLLFLGENSQINGTELAQGLIRNRVSLALFNACWGAHPYQDSPRSSLAEVLIHHGVPAVLAMRDSIADQEALKFIEVFTRALTQGKSIDHAVAVARQDLLTVYKFNQPAWTLPILYLHPQYDGSLLKLPGEIITELPTVLPSSFKNSIPPAYLRSMTPMAQQWQVEGGIMRVGRRQENDLMVKERWVSQKHAEIIYREQDNYHLRDFSRFGTLVKNGNDWQTIHHSEISLISGMEIKFGSSYGQSFEFIMQD
jgi:hypothetical protein